METLGKLETMLEELRSNFIDENSPAFKEYIHNEQLENDVIEIPYYPSYNESSWGIKESEAILNHYCFIDKLIYTKIKEELKESKYPRAVNEISSILKKAYYKTIIAKLNIENRKEMVEFAKAYTSFAGFLSKNITGLNFKGELTGEILKIKNSHLLSLIKSIFTESILEDPYTSEFIVSTNDYDYLHLFDLTDIYINLSIVDLLYYIQKHNVLDNKDFGNHYEYQFSNKHLELVYKLLIAASLINDDNIKSDSKDYMRTRMTNYKNKLQSNTLNNVWQFEIIEDHTRLGIKKGDSLLAFLEKLLNDTTV